MRLGVALLIVSTLPVAGENITLKFLSKEIVDKRLEAYSGPNEKRETVLKSMFEESGCTALAEQLFKKKSPPNLICTLPGESDLTIVVGAHFDHAPEGDGVVDNWSGAALLPTLYESLAQHKRRHTFVFVNFSDEEKGLVGSRHYVKKLTSDQRAKVVAMVNIDTIGTGPLSAELSRSDKTLLQYFRNVTGSTGSAFRLVNVDQVGMSDGQSFSPYKIPILSMHSITQETFPILHTASDKIDAIKRDDYYQSYRTIASYLAYLDAKARLQ